MFGSGTGWAYYPLAPMITCVERVSATIPSRDMPVLVMSADSITIERNDLRP